MKELKDLTLADLFALFSYYRLMIEDIMEHGNSMDEIIVIESKITAINNEIQKRIDNIIFK